MRAHLTAVVVLFSLGCGGSPAPAASGGAVATSGGDNEQRISLRVQAQPGMRYGTRSTGTTISQGVTITSEALGEMQVESFDPGARTSVLGSTVQSIRLADAAGRPVEGAATAYDLTGVSFRRTIDERGSVVGRVEASGTSETNAAFAETMRSTFEQAFIKLPEQPVRAGDSWSDTVTLTVPVETLMLEMTCRIAYRMEGTEGQGATLAARLAFDTTCETPETPIGPDGGSLQISSRSVGSQTVAVLDGLAGTLDLSTDTTTVVRIPGSPEPVTLTMSQRQHTTTAPLAR